MKKAALFILIVIVSLTGISGDFPEYMTDFTMTVFITNKSGESKRLFLEKGRILEIAKINSSHFQSIIITEGDGWVTIPANQTVRRQIRGICLHDGLQFPQTGERIVLTPFVGDEELIQAGNDQEAVHRLTAFPKDNVMIITAKGYSDATKDGREKDKDEAFQAAVENAARESGFIFSSETILESMNLIRTRQQIRTEEKSIKLNRVIHEEYDEEKGEYLYIGEFEVRSKPSRPEINK